MVTYLVIKFIYAGIRLQFMLLVRYRLKIVDRYFDWAVSLISHSDTTCLSLSFCSSYDSSWRAFRRKYRSPSASQPLPASPFLASPSLFGLPPRPTRAGQVDFFIGGLWATRSRGTLFSSRIIVIELPVIPPIHLFPQLPLTSSLLSSSRRSAECRIHANICPELTIALASSPAASCWLKQMLPFADSGYPDRRGDSIVASARLKFTHDQVGRQLHSTG